LLLFMIFWCVCVCERERKRERMCANTTLAVVIEGKWKTLV